MNRELALKVADRIDHCPNGFDMNHWASCIAKYVLQEEFDTVRMTGDPTMAYVAPALRKHNRLGGEQTGEGIIVDIEQAAQKLLDLPDDDIFYWGRWPAKYREMSWAQLPKDQAKAAAALLRMLASLEPEQMPEEELVPA